MINQTLARLVSAVLCLLSLGCRQQAAPLAVDSTSGDPDAYETWTGSDGGSLAGIATLDLPSALHEHRHAGAAADEAAHQVPANSRRAAGLDGRLPEVVVYLADIRKGRALDPASAPALLNQRSMQFEPRVQLVAPGTDLEIRNSDPTSHNVRGVLEDTRETLFNYAMPLQDQRLHVALRRPGRVNVMCDMKHGWMKATLVVMKHPYYAITDGEGRFELAGVPPGEYSLRAWHDSFGERTVRVQVRPFDVTRVAVSFSF